MTTIIRKKILCSKCNKLTGTLTCRGCINNFCYEHINEHRQELNEQMDEVITRYDELQHIIAEQAIQPDIHTLMGKINEWEEQSIEKIHQTAIKARKELLIILDVRRNKVMKDLIYLTQELNTVRNEANYVETDMKQWLEKLEKLKRDLNDDQIIDFGQDNNKNNALISKIFINGISTDYFDCTIGDIDVLDDGKLAIHGQLYGTAGVHGKSEYSSGQHHLRFRIEHWNSNGNISIGIISKRTSKQTLLYTFNHRNIYECTYNSLVGFTPQNKNNLFYFTGRNCINSTDSIVELLIDCDQRMICLINEQTQQQLSVNLFTCPLPWQFFITLLYPNDRVHLIEKTSY